MTPDQSSLNNRLLRLAAPEDFAQVAPHLSPVDLPRTFVVCEPDQDFTDAYFFETGIGSVIAISPEGQQIEAGLFGHDGMTPSNLVLGSTQTQHRILVQVAGRGWRLPAATLKTIIDERPAFRSLLNRYVQTLATQASYTALSNAVHPIDERLARWLLMCDDRCAGGLQLTHEYMSIMLSVRRPSVTTALHALEGNGFIRAERGRIVVTNRAAMEAFAGDAYGRPEAEYARLVGPMAAPVQ